MMWITREEESAEPSATPLIDLGGIRLEETPACPDREPVPTVPVASYFLIFSTPFLL